MADRNGYIGRAPSDSSVVVARQVFSPAGVTTDFTFTSGYSVGYLDAYLNGARLIEGQDYNATDGSAISLVSAATNGDVLELVAYKAFNVATATVGIYSGGDPISTQVNTLNFIGAGNTFALRGSTVDISIAGGGGGVGFATDAVGLHTSSTVGISTNSARTGLALYVVGNQENTGILTAATLSATTGSFSGNVSIAGTLTYEDVTNVDSVGLVTARSGVRITAGGLVVTSGVTTLTDNTFVGSGVSIYSATGIVSATAFYGSGANLTGLPAGGVEIQSAGSPLGAGVTIINFQSGATVTASGAGSTITISAGLQTAAASGGAVTLNLSSAQDHKVTATGITTITVSGGTEGDSHTVRIVNSGIATVGFSTYFLFPSGSPPSLPTTSGAISLLSFTVHRVGAAGTQLLAGASLNFS